MSHADASTDASIVASFDAPSDHRTEIAARSNFGETEHVGGDQLRRFLCCLRRRVCSSDVSHTVAPSVASFVASFVAPSDHHSVDRTHRASAERKRPPIEKRSNAKAVSADPRARVVGFCKKGRSNEKQLLLLLL